MTTFFHFFIIVINIDSICLHAWCRDAINAYVWIEQTMICKCIFQYSLCVLCVCSQHISTNCFVNAFPFNGIHITINRIEMNRNKDHIFHWMVYSKFKLLSNSQWEKVLIRKGARRHTFKYYNIHLELVKKILYKSKISNEWKKVIFV